MSLDGGYFKSMDYMLERFRSGRERGQDEGYAHGSNEGYAAGYAAAVAQYSDALDQAHANMLQQIDITDEIGAERDQLAERLEEQQRHIALLQAKVASLAEQLEAQSSERSELLALNSVLRDSNKAMESEIKELKSRTLAKLEADQSRVWIFNQNLVITNTLARVIQDLCNDDSEECQRISALFEKHYVTLVDDALAQKAFKSAPHNDEAFQKRLPGTLAFINRMMTTLEVPEHKMEVVEESESFEL